MAKAIRISDEEKTFELLKQIILSLSITMDSNEKWTSIELNHVFKNLLGHISAKDRKIMARVHSTWRNEVELFRKSKKLKCVLSGNRWASKTLLQYEHLLKVERKYVHFSVNFQSKTGKCSKFFNPQRVLKIIKFHQEWLTHLSIRADMSHETCQFFTKSGRLNNLRSLSLELHFGDNKYYWTILNNVIGITSLEELAITEKAGFGTSLYDSTLSAFSNVNNKIKKLKFLPHFEKSKSANGAFYYIVERLTRLTELNLMEYQVNEDDVPEGTYEYIFDHIISRVYDHQFLKVLMIPSNILSDRILWYKNILHLQVSVDMNLKALMAALFWNTHIEVVSLVDATGVNDFNSFEELFQTICHLPHIKQIRLLESSEAGRIMLYNAIKDYIKEGFPITERGVELGLKQRILPHFFVGYRRFKTEVTVDLISHKLNDHELHEFAKRDEISERERRPIQVVLLENLKRIVVLDVDKQDEIRKKRKLRIARSKFHAKQRKCYAKQGKFSE